MPLTSRQQTIQNQIDALDSSASTGSMLSLLNRAIAEGGIRWGYDSESFFPGYDSADLDSDYIGMFAFHDGDSDLWFHGQDLQWHKLDSAANVPPPPTPIAQAENYGYTAGGYFSQKNIIDKYSLSSDANATDVGDLTYGKVQNAGTSSASYAYSLGGQSPSDPGKNPSSIVNIIEKWPTAADANATDVADLLSAWNYGGATFSIDHGYALAGNGTTGSNVIQKHQFSNDGDATDVGDLLGSYWGNTATSTSPTHGYQAGAATSPTVFINVIEKFPFAVDEGSGDVGDLLSGAQFGQGNQSSTHGYHSGGQIPAFTYQNVIEKYSHSSDGNATDVGDMFSTGQFGYFSSSTTHGYNANTTPPVGNVTIQKFSFSSDGNATDVADTTEAKYNGASAQS